MMFFALCLPARALLHGGMARALCFFAGVGVGFAFCLPFPALVVRSVYVAPFPPALGDQGAPAYQVLVVPRAEVAVPSPTPFWGCPGGAPRVSD